MQSKVFIGIVGLVITGFIGLVAVNREASPPVAANQQTVREGMPAPDFSLPSAQGKTVALSDYKGKRNVLIYFHEGLTCDPCLQQMPELEKSLAAYEKLNTALLFVSLDSPKEQQQIVQKYSLQSPALSYLNAKTEQDYNLLPYSMGMGRRAGHTFVLVGVDGKILWRKEYWPSVGMSVPGGKMFVPASEIETAVKKVLGA